MPILNGLSTQNKAEIKINGVFMYRVYCGGLCVWQKLKAAAGLGRLYNFPTIEDVLNAISYLGGELMAGGDLKALETWTPPNTGATDSKGFKALPAGTRDELGAFANILLQNNIWIDNR